MQSPVVKLQPSSLIKENIFHLFVSYFHGNFYTRDIYFFSDISSAKLSLCLYNILRNQDRSCHLPVACTYTSHLLDIES
jgi:hypothetical protein